jgi:plasmid stabilization system protein ParE
MTFTVRVLGRATADVDHIYVWLRQRSPEGAAAWYAAYLDKLRELAESVAASSIAPEATKFGIELRQAFFKTRQGRTYRLLFVIAGNDLRVLRVRGPGQRPVSRRDLPAEEP